MPTLLLDCDGVLADTEKHGHLPAFNQAFEEAGLDVSWNLEEYIDLVKIGGGKERLAYYFKQHPAAAKNKPIDELVAELHRLKTEKYIDLIQGGAIPGRPGIRRLVNEAKSRGWIVAVASTSAFASVQAVVNSVLGSGTIDAIFAGDVVPAKKPAPDIYLLAMKETDADPEQTVVVEDSETGATAAYNAGLPHVVTHSALSAHEDFPHASLIVSDLGEPGAPAELRGGQAEFRERVPLVNGMVTVATLEKVLKL
ncbi:HAD-IA family hydrolase [Actinomycetaceae bacterium L2_0104]